MAVVINTAADSNYFTLNGTQYARIYQPLKGQVSTEVGIYNAYDTCQQLLASTPYDEFIVDGLGYASADLLLVALLPVIYKYSTAGVGIGSLDWGDITGTLSAQTDLQTALNLKSDVGHTHSFASLTSKPTTLAGFGITDAYTQTQITSLLSGKADNVHTHVEADITDLQAYLLDAPSNGSEYVRLNGAWSVATGGGGGGATDAYAETVATGIVSGGIITINGADNTKFDISAGKGYIVDNTVEPATVTTVSWGAFTSQTVTNLATSFATDLAINSAGAILQQNSYTATETRENIVLGGLDHSNQSNIGSVFALQKPVAQPASSINELANAIGAINLNGNIYNANIAGNLTIDKSAGSVFSYGRNNTNSETEPNTLTTAADVLVNFNYVFNNGTSIATFGASTTNIDPDNYDNGTGTLATVANSKWTIQRVLFFANSNKTFIQYGTEVFNKLTDAQDAIARASFVALSGVKTAQVRGYIIVKKGASDLTNSAQAYFISADRLGIIAGAGTASTAAWGGITGTLSDQTDLQSALNGKASTATTLSGYGITNAYTKTETDNKYLLNTTDTLTGDFTATGNIISNTGGRFLARTGLGTNNLEHGRIEFQSDRTDRYSAVTGYRYGLSGYMGLKFLVSNNAAPIVGAEIDYAGNFKATGNILTTARVGAGTTVPEAALHSYESTALGGTAGNSQIIARFEGETGNDIKKDLFLVRNITGADWTTANLHDSVSIDSSFLTPQTDTKTWWERNPYAGEQSWGNGATTGMTLSSAGNLDITGGFTVGSASDIVAGSGGIRRLTTNAGILVGSYDDDGNTTNSVGAIYCMGTALKPSSTTNLGNMYGIGYCYGSVIAGSNGDLGSTPSSEWGMYVAADGEARLWFNGTSGISRQKGAAYASSFINNSDRRRKTNIEDYEAVELGIKWQSFELDSEQGNYRVGVIAQDLLGTPAEKFVNQEDPSNYTVNYIDLHSAALAQKDKEIEDLNKRLDILELIIKELI